MKTRAVMMLKRFCRLVSPCAAALLLVSACGSDPQCQSDRDCPEAGACSEVSCNAGICETTTLDDCCGNGSCEAATENECTCPEDCGACEGQIAFVSESGDDVEAKYLKRQCIDGNLCSVIFQTDEQVYREEFHEIAKDGLVFNVVVRYPNPLAVIEDSVVLEMELVEKNDPRVQYPVTVSNALVLDGPRLFGQNQSRYQFEALGDRIEVVIPIAGGTRMPEEDHELQARVIFDYTYLEEKQAVDDGKLVYDQYGNPVMRTVRDKVVRSDLVLGLAETVTLVSRKAG
jgi:hypothetical protein